MFCEMRFRFLSAMRWRAAGRDIESPTVPWLSVIYVCQGQIGTLCLDVNGSACFNCYRHKVICAAESRMLDYLLRCRFDGDCTCAFRSFVNLGGQRTYPSRWHPNPVGLPRTHGISVAPDGRFPSVRDRPIGSLVAGMWPFFKARQMRSSTASDDGRGELFLQERPWIPLASTAVPQIQVWGWHVVDPNRYPTATRIAASSDRRRLTAVIGGALSQSPSCVTATVLSLALSTGVSQLISRSLSYYWCFPNFLNVSRSIAWLAIRC